MSGGGFLEKGQVLVRNGPCSSEPMQQNKIPLDGRVYCCAGTIILKNGIELRADFEISTHTFDFLNREYVRVLFDGIEYYLQDEKLYEKLGIIKDDAFPYKWMPDIPLDYHVSGPYPMNFYI